MNTPDSQQGNLTRYAVFLAFYLIVIGMKALCTLGNKLHTVGVIFFVLISLAVLLFYIRRFNREKRYFEKSFSLPMLGDFSFTLGLTILIIGSRILLAYLQAQGKIPVLSLQNFYLRAESTPIFWFLIFAVGIILPVLQQFLCNGFFFNYYFRTSNFTLGVIGIICSGIFYSVLNLQFSLVLLVINALYGMAFAWSYLYSQSLWIPIYLSILNGIFTVILL